MGANRARGFDGMLTLLNQTEIAGMSHRFYAYAPVYLR